MKHQDFRNVAIDDAFDAIEGNILPSLTFLVERASVAQPGTDAVPHADELRALARQLEALTNLFEANAATGQPPADPFRTPE